MPFSIVLSASADNAECELLGGVLGQRLAADDLFEQLVHPLVNVRGRGYFLDDVDSVGLFGIEDTTDVEQQLGLGWS
ncbi:hypothetical protein [Nesterenkonia ebinurensis]|uniref:hypothetical protein n=1 Tax=Nesterenkonia ebinurensis TaxID=2608252 RepID=UPI00123DD5A0|nr:hypothetical protein [Nesterenkonia ebinurensis]